MKAFKQHGYGPVGQPYRRALRVCRLWWGIFLLSLVGFSCGLANYSFNNSSSGSGSKASFQNSSSQGTFESAGGRLTSQGTCSDNDNCVDLCDSMLERLSLQKDCYEKKEDEVQALRDTYNLLALGNPRKLARVEPTEMEELLEFAPELYGTAIKGFERGRKENCKVVTNKEILAGRDPRDREDCKLKDYYMQYGYSSEGAMEALEWIARNDWLAELLLKHDKDYVIMLALLEILAEGGEHPVEDGDDNLNKDVNGDDTPNRSSVCVWGERSGTSPPQGDSDFSSFTGHGRLTVQASSAPSDRRNQYQAFGADCLDMNSDKTQGENYFRIARKGENEDSIKLGQEVLKELCDGADACFNQFCQNIISKDNSSGVGVLDPRYACTL